MVDICLLGCGGMMPLPDRKLTALLYKYNGRMILIDCGEGTQVSVKLSGWGFKSIDALLITHYHADHIAGLPGFLLTLGNSGRTEPFTIFGPPYLKEVIKGLTVVSPQLPYTINLIELTDEYETSFQIGEINISSIPIDHSIPCLSYSLELKRAGKFDKNKAENNSVPLKYWSLLQKGNIEADGVKYKPHMVLGEPRKGIKVTYCTDTRPIDALISFAKESDLFICEGMYGEDEKLPAANEKKHMTFTEAANLAELSGSKELWLTHFSPSMNHPELYVDNVRTIFPQTLTGKDIMFKKLVFENHQENT